MEVLANTSGAEAAVGSLAGNLIVSPPAAALNPEGSAAYCQQLSHWLAGHQQNLINALREALKVDAPGADIEIDGRVQARVHWPLVAEKQLALLSKLAASKAKYSVAFEAGAGGEIELVVPVKRDGLPVEITVWQGGLQIHYPIAKLQPFTEQAVREDQSYYLAGRLNSWLAEHRDRLTILEGRPSNIVCMVQADISWARGMWERQDFVRGARLSKDAALVLDDTGAKHSLTVLSVNAEVSPFHLPKFDTAVLSAGPAAVTYVLELLASVTPSHKTVQPADFGWREFPQKVDGKRLDEWLFDQRTAHIIKLFESALCGTGCRKFANAFLLAMSSDWQDLRAEIESHFTSVKVLGQPALSSEQLQKMGLRPVDEIRQQHQAQKELAQKKADLKLFQGLIAGLSEDPNLAGAVRLELVSKAQLALTFAKQRNFAKAASALQDLQQHAALPVEFQSSIQAALSGL